MTSRISHDQRMVVAEHVSTSELHGELVLLNFASETYFGLDEIGSRMLSMLTDAPSTEAGVQALLGEFEVDEERLRADIATLVDRLLEGGLVELRAA